MGAYLTIQGRLARDPQQRMLSNGSTVVGITVVVNDGWGDQSQPENQHASFYHANFFGKARDIILRHFKKGSPIILNGEFHTREYQDNQGQLRTALEFYNARFEFCFREPQEQGNQATAKIQNDNGDNGVMNSSHQGTQGQQNSEPATVESANNNFRG